MLPGSVMVVQIIKKIDRPVELIEEAAADTKATVKQLDRANKGAAQNILKPSKTLLRISLASSVGDLDTYRISNWNTKQ